MPRLGREGEVETDDVRLSNQFVERHRFHAEGALLVLREWIDVIIEDLDLEMSQSPGKLPADPPHPDDPPSLPRQLVNADLKRLPLRPFPLLGP